MSENKDCSITENNVTCGSPWDDFFVALAANKGLAATDFTVTEEFLVERDNRGRTLLIFATEKGCVDAVKMLLPATASLSCAVRLKTLALMAAAFQGHIEVVSSFLADGVDVNTSAAVYRQKKGWTALMHAAAAGHVACVKSLIAARADLNALCERGYTALMLAVEQGHRDVVAALLDAGADTTVRGERIEDALLVAVAAQDELMVKLLLDRGVDVKTAHKFCPYVAAQRGNAAIVGMLVAAGANINRHLNAKRYFAWREGRVRHKYGRHYFPDAECSDDDYDSEWHSSDDEEEEEEEGEEKGHGEEEVGADGAATWPCFDGDAVDMAVREKKLMPQIDKESVGGDMLLTAIANNHEAATQTLIAARADVNADDSSQHTALMRAVVTGNPRLVGMLLAARADPNPYEVWYSTALTLAVERNDTHIAQMLLDAGAHATIVNERSRDVEPPLLCALWNGNTALAQVLVDAGADVQQRARLGPPSVWRDPNTLAEYDATLLTHAVRENMGVDVLTFLMDAKADVNALNDDGSTAFMWAATRGDAATIALLLRAKARVHQQDREDRTALSYAIEYDCRAGFDLLLAAGASIGVVAETDAESASKERSQRTPLFDAARYNRVTLAEELLARKADVNHRKTDGSTPLICAVAAGHAAMVRLLIAADADLGICTKDSTSLVMAACYPDHTEALEEMLKHTRTGAGVDALLLDTPNEYGQTPLMFCVYIDQVQHLRVLLQAMKEVCLGDADAQRPVKKSRTKE